MIDHLIFDFDGTISDSYPHFIRFTHDFATQNELPFLIDDITLERNMRINLKTGFDSLNWKKLISYKTFLDAFHQFQENSPTVFRAFPEAVELLTYSVQQGKKNYLYTHTGAVVNKMLKHMKLEGLFTFVLDQSFGFPAKPAPDALLFLLRKFDLDPKRCMMIGDRPIDANAGMNAGMQGCLWDKDGLYPNATVDHKVQMLSEMKRFI